MGTIHAATTDTAWVQRATIITIIIVTALLIITGLTVWLHREVKRGNFMSDSPTHRFFGPRSPRGSTMALGPNSPATSGRGDQAHPSRKFLDIPKSHQGRRNSFVKAYTCEVALAIDEDD